MKAKIKVGNPIILKQELIDKKNKKYRKNIERYTLEVFEEIKKLSS